MYIRENRHIDTDKVRATCIRNGYYTQGTNEEYSKMFQKCGLNYGILAIATDILDHSDQKRIEFETAMNRKEILETICFDLINNCSYTTVSLED